MHSILDVQSKVPLHLIIATAPLEVFCVNYMSIEMTMDLDQSPKVVNILVFQDHSVKHIMAYATSDQTTKTVAKFLYQGYILTSGALTKLLRDLGANFTGNIIWELCELMGIEQIGTSPYHAQTNGQVECTHQTIMQMIEKPGKDQKANWLNYVLEMVQAYSSRGTTVVGKNPHYPMSQ